MDQYILSACNYAHACTHRDECILELLVHVRRTHGIVCALLWIRLMYVGGARVAIGTCNNWST